MFGYVVVEIKKPVIANRTQKKSSTINIARKDTSTYVVWSLCPYAHEKEKSRMLFSLSFRSCSFI